MFSLRSLWKYRGTHVITCPENLKPAAVRVAPATDAHLSACSRWPEMAGCDQACFDQIERSPDGCRVKTLVSVWYAGKHCHYCGREIGPIVWHERPPAALRPDGVTVEWKEVAPEQLPEIFKTCDPVCWACHVVETFRREHPSVVIERKHMPSGHKAIPPTRDVY